MFRAVIWDFGGVLTTSPFEEFNRYEAANGIPKDFIRRVNATNPDSNAWAQLESNEISSETFDRAFLSETSALGHPIPGAAVLSLLSGALRPRMVEALKVCREAHNLKVACITNNVRSVQGDGMAAGRERAREVEAVMALFDLVVESSVEGIRKPNPEIYRRACERLGIAPRDAIYLDDLGINCKPARALGMHTIKVVEEGQALADLAAALDAPSLREGLV
ncbi:MAG: HAD-IA family hydrolase [Gammaproteobacteria bacterium]|nr:HAD-IA family hydrolase [Gammaproteobacteria bacterium]